MNSSVASVIAKEGLPGPLYMHLFKNWVFVRCERHRRKACKTQKQVGKGGKTQRNLFDDDRWHGEWKVASGIARRMYMRMRCLRERVRDQVEAGANFDVDVRVEPAITTDCCTARCRSHRQNRGSIACNRSTSVVTS